MINLKHLCLTPLILASVFSAQASEKLLEGPSRILVLGDSITQTGHYVSYFDAWLVQRFPEKRFTVINGGLASETVSGLSEPGHARGNFPRPDLHERLERVVAKAQPDLIIANYGMNCGIYLELDEARFARYREGIRKLRAVAAANGAEVVHVTPPIYDHHGADGFDYDTVLAAYADWLVGQRAEGWHVIDLHNEMRAKVDAARAENPDFTVQKDNIHPNPAGHWMMAQSLIAYFGDPQAAALSGPEALIEADRLAAVEERMKTYLKAIHAETKPLRPRVPKGGDLESAAAMARQLAARIYPAPAAGSVASDARVYELWEPEPAPNRGHDYSIEKPGRGYPYDADWERWSYPLGNGTLGANVFGRTDVERIQLTEKTMANGSAYNRGGLTSAAELYLDFAHEAVSDYRRALVLNDGLQHVTYESGGVRYEREYFVSYPDDVMVIRLTADRPGALSFAVRGEIPYLDAKEPRNSKTGTVSAAGDTLTLAGTIEFFQVNYELQVKVLPEGGELSADGGVLRVDGADAVTLLVAADTNYELSPDIFLNDIKDKLDPDVYPHERVAAKIDAAAQTDYAQLKERHVADHRGLFGRVSVNLGPKGPEQPTHERLKAYQAGEADSFLEELMFQYGRYLIIASSRSTTLPANLQGAWSQYEVTPWTGGYWHNINVQMNYWGSKTTDLAETFEAYVNYFEAYLPKAIEYAQAYMRERRPEKFSDVPEENGWTFGNGSNAYVLPATASHSGPGTQAFITIMLMEYYNFTQDETFLREVAYPAMRMLSRFYSKSLIETEDGLLLVEDSASPEIKEPWPHPVPGGTHYQTVGCTYDQSLVWQNHSDLLRAAEILGIEDDPFLEKVRSQIPRLDPILIGASGQIKEFREEAFYGEIGDPNHRHISQLVGLYPGDLINSSRPEWMAAASKTLDLRGNEATGWAMAHRMNARARLKEAEAAHEVFGKFIREKTLPNLWTVHPPFQIDGNLGVMAGVAEMLLQSHEGVIEPLPALPEAWATGNFDGLVARGNFKVSAEWAEGALTALEVHSRAGKACRLRHPALAGAAVFDENGLTVELLPSAEGELRFETKVGGRYLIQL